MKNTENLNFDTFLPFWPYLRPWLTVKWIFFSDIRQYTFQNGIQQHFQHEKHINSYKWPWNTLFSKKICFDKSKYGGPFENAFFAILGTSSQLLAGRFVFRRKNTLKSIFKIKLTFNSTIVIFCAWLKLDL